MIEFLFLHNLFEVETDEGSGEYNKTCSPVATEQGAEWCIGKSYQEQCAKWVHFGACNDFLVFFPQGVERQMIVISFPAECTQFGIQLKTDGKSGDDGYFIINFSAVDVAYAYYHSLLKKAHFHVYIQWLSDAAGVSYHAWSVYTGTHKTIGILQ